jgi:ribosomal protein L7/L12
MSDEKLTIIIKDQLFLLSDQEAESALRAIQAALHARSSNYQLNAFAQRSPDEMTENEKALRKTIEDLVAKNEKILAIRYLRSATNCGLFAAKTFIDSVELEMAQKNNPEAEGEPTAAGDSPSVGGV